MSYLNLRALARTALLAAATTCALSVPLGTATAQAATYSVVGTGGTLHVRTAASLSAPTVANLPDRTAIDIVCQTRGDQVVGSTMWDRIDRPVAGYVADWYTSTPVTNNFSPGLPDCSQLSNGGGGNSPAGGGGSNSGAGSSNSTGNTSSGSTNTGSASGQAPPSFADVAQSYNGQREVPASIARAWHVGPHWSGYCEAFVGLVTLRLTGHGRPYGSALADYRDHLRHGLIHYGAPPRGAVVYWNPRGSGGFGHIGISLGNGMEISTYGFAGGDSPIQIHSYRYFGNYLGWAMP